MKLRNQVDLRPVVAAGIMLTILAGAYEAAHRLPHLAFARRLASPVRETIATATDTTTVTGVEAAPLPAPTPELTPCPAEPIRFVQGSPAERRPLGLHRYVGTVGGQPATVLLQWPTLLDGMSGSFYLHRGGPTYALVLLEGRKSRPVLRVDNPEDFGSGSQGEWRLPGRPGAVLRGTWHDTTGNHPLVLRESYAGAVRADVQTLLLRGGQPHRGPYDAACETGSYYYSYLQFPGAWAVAPVLRHALGPPPAVVRRRLRASYDDGYEQQRNLGGFLLNDFNLLSYQVGRFNALVTNGGKGDSWTESYLFDLTTGRELTLASQLRPDYERPLRRLIQQHLLHDARFNFINREHRATWDWRDAAGKATNLVALPAASRYADNGHASGLCLTGSGLDATYSSEGLYYSDEPGEQQHTISISYAELRPLVRPGTPLAHMLRARGLW